MTDYTLVAEMDRSTVVGRFEPVESDRNPLLYESEAALERLNRMTFTDREWDGFFATHFANDRLSLPDKAETIQEDFVKVLRRDDGTAKNIKLLDKANIHNNQLQVINQYEVGDSRFSRASRVSSASSGPCGYSPLHKNRYDVTILVNGIPLVHCELKRRGVAIREAFNQINRYARESFWAGSGLFGFVQIFVISNGTHTKYYSNTTRYQHVRERTLRGMGLHAGLGGARRSSNSFEFTSWWADGENRPIEDLYGFARTFMSKHTLLAVLTRYCVWTEERHLMVMRPYQIAATERILQRIVTAVNQKWEGTVRGGGFIWHTTGSGKTLTSFKTATLAARMDGVDKVLFVVDRSDLDYQTIREYDKFQKGAANSNANTAILERQLRDPNARIIITTIQKLGLLCGRGLPKGAESRRTVIIFDECHRSQFGELQDYQSVYLDLHDKWKPVVKSEKASILDGVEFEMDLVRQVDINIDYILMLVARYHETNAQDKELLGAIEKAIGSSMALRSKKELIQRFIESINAQSGDMAEAWGAFVAQEQEREIAELIEEESLREPETRAFFRKALEDGVLRGAGTDMDLILPPMSRFGAAAAGREEKKRRVFERLSALFDRYRGLGTMG